jgi:S1-C subfamily serine protease
LVLTGDCVVNKLWADSPADKAGLQLGDHLWSIGKAGDDPQEKKILETGLSTLPVTVFVASDSDWNKALIAKNSSMTPTFRPKLRKVLLGTL